MKDSPHQANEYVFEPLQRTIALAMRLGFTILFDQRGKLPVTVPQYMAGTDSKEQWNLRICFQPRANPSLATLPLDHR